MTKILKLQSNMGDSSFIVGVCDDNRNTSRDKTEKRLKKTNGKIIFVIAVLDTDIKPQI